MGFQEIYKPIHLNINLSTSFGKGSEFLAPEYDSKKSEFENALLNSYDKKKNKIQNYRTVPNRLSKIRISMKFFEKLFLAFDIINTEGWYSKNIISKSQYDNAEYNPTFDPYFFSNKISGYTAIDMNTHLDINKYIRIMGKITNLSNIVYSGQGAYDGSQNLDINPQYRRNYYLGVEVNHNW